MLEGPHLVEEALATGLALDSVLVTPSFCARPESAALLARLPRPPLEVADELLEELADSDSPRGILAVARLPRLDASEIPLREHGTYLLAEGVQEPGNLGAIARVAEAFGVDALALTGESAHPNHPRALRASAGSLLRLPVARAVEPERLADHLAPLAPTWAALTAHGGEPLLARRDSSALVLVCGAEGAGLSDTLLARADVRWTIPLGGRAESLNVAVAVGIALYALRTRSTLSS